MSVLYHRLCASLGTLPRLSSRRFTSSHHYESPARPFRVAIVGSGPSGCYTAKYLQQVNNTHPTHIDIVERLPTAYGLVRNGVAPDHPEVKNVQHDFDALMLEKSENVQFYGNVAVGKDISVKELRELYDMVVLSYGCESDRSLSQVPGAHLEGVLSARQFVAWYNGHVDYDWVGPIVQDSLGSSTSSSHQDIVVVGHGNVALDCARILAKTRDELDPTDLTTRALEILHPSCKAGSTPAATAIATPLQRTISVVGRRGHVQGAFTIKELRELTKLPHADFVVRSDEIDMGKSSAASRKELEGNRPRTRIDTLLTDAASHLPQQVKKDRQIQLRFLLNPVRFEADPENPSRLGSVVCERTQLIGEPGSQGAVGTGEEEAIPAQLALVSIGYKGVAIEGTAPWFDESRGILKNTHGLVASSVGTLGAVYTAGWLKRGPSGIIGTNIPDAKDTVATILHDMAGLSPKSNSSPPLRDLLEARGVQYVDWESYRRIDAAETNCEQKRQPNQPREKITRLEELLKVARGDSD